MEDRKPYTVQELADRWSCNRESVYAKIRSGALKAFTIGGRHYRVTAEVVDSWERNGVEVLRPAADVIDMRLRRQSGA